MNHIISSNAKIYFKEYGKGETLLVLRGGPGVDHKYMYMLGLKNLSKHYRVIFVDQRGNGKSKITDYDTLNFDCFTSDLENLRKHLKINKWTIVGHSFGGFVALEYAIRYTEHLSKLVLIDTGFDAKQVRKNAPENLLKFGYFKKSAVWASRFFNGNLSLFQAPFAFLRFAKGYFYRFD